VNRPVRKRKGEDLFLRENGERLVSDVEKRKKG